MLERNNALVVRRIVNAKGNEWIYLNGNSYIPIYNNIGGILLKCNKMTDLQVYGLNIFALIISMSPITEYLQIIVLLLTIVYTCIGIYKKLKEAKKI